jgi:hypothetical protein
MVLLAKTGRHYFYKPPGANEPLEFWAQNGMICIVDQRVPSNHRDSYDVLTIREFLLNIKMINASIGRCADHAAKVAIRMGRFSTAGGSAAEERASMHKLVSNAISCGKEAQDQGSPDNPRHVEQMLRQRRNHMLYAGSSTSYAGNGSGAKSATFAPEGLLLPPLAETTKPKKQLIVP